MRDLSKKKSFGIIVPTYFILPAILLYFIFFFAPIIVSSGLSFTKWDAYNIREIYFIGIANFLSIFKYSRLLSVAKNSFIYAITVVVFQNLFGFFLSIFLYQKTKINEFFRAIFFLPVIISTIVVGYIFTAVLSPHGFLNRFLSTIFFTDINFAWLGSIAFTIFVVAFIAIWQGSGFTMMIFVAALNAIPVELSESAKLDGANNMQIIKSIYIPMIMPAILVNLVSSIIGSLRAFDLVYAVTNGGPARTTELFNFVILKTYSLGYFSEAIAMNLVLMILIIVISIPVYINLRKRIVEL